MKIKKVAANNRKRAFEITAARGTYEYPYSRLKPAPGPGTVVKSVASDPEVGHEGFSYRLDSRKEGTVLMDQVLEYSKDPDYLRKMLLFKLTMKAKKRIEELGIKKREVIRRMRTTPTQFYRLLDQKNTGKTIDQMVKLLAALDCPIDLVFEEAA